MIPRRVNLSSLSLSRLDFKQLFQAHSGSKNTRKTYELQIRKILSNEIWGKVFL